MAKLHVAAIGLMFMVLIFVTVEGKNRALHARDLGKPQHGSRCTNDQQRYPYLPLCPSSSTSDYTTIKETTEPSSPSTQETIVEEDEDTTSSSQTDSTSTPTLLERAHWCRLVNGTYLPLGYNFMQNPCVSCECTKSRAVRCKTVQCMPTYCIDNSMPIRRSGQCCTQCSYEPSNTSCVYNEVSYQHGAVIKFVDNQMRCWCQLGNIECRNYTSSLLDGTDLWSDGTAVYIIVIVIGAALILGLLTCCACTFFTYHYYQKYQYAIQQAYDEYVNSSGWQPVDEEQENPDNLAAEEKRIEAENSQYYMANIETVPPPYATVHNTGMPVDEPQQK